MANTFGEFLHDKLQERGVESREQILDHASTLVAEGKVPERELGFRSLSEGLFGSAWQEKLRDGMADMYRGKESADAIDASAFTQISGNQLISRVRDGYNLAGMIGDEICTTIPIANQNLQTEKEPWLSSVRTLATDALLTQPGMEFPKNEFSKSYVLRNIPEKRGEIVEVTWEAIYADRTRQMHAKAMSIGEAMRLDKEKRILRLFLGLSGANAARTKVFQNTRFTYSFDGQTETTRTGYTENAVSGASEVCLNQLDSTKLLSWVDLNAMEQLFAKMKDPVTGEPIEVNATDIFVMPSRKHIAASLLNPHWMRIGTNATTTAALSSNNVLTEANSPIGSYRLLTSKHAFKLADVNELFEDQAGANGAALTAGQADDLWLMGDFKKAIAYYEVVPLETRVAAPNSPKEFYNDIPLAVRAREIGVANWLDPRYIARAFGHAQNASSS